VSLFRDEHMVLIDSTEVAVTAQTGPVHATWSLLFDGTVIDEATATGNFRLRGTLQSGVQVEANVQQSMLGPTEVAVHRDGAEVARFTGFVM
jgi:hypothetical protein